MKIVHVVPYYAPAYSFGGVVASALMMTRALAQKGHEVTVITTDALSPTERIPASEPEWMNQVRVIRVRNLSLKARRWANLSLPLKLASQAEPWLTQADIIHLHEFRTIENLLLQPLLKRLNKPVFLSPHGTLDITTGRGILKQAWDRFFSPSVAKQIHTVIGLTSVEVEMAKTLWQTLNAPLPHFTVIPNGVNLETFAHLPDAQTFRARYQLGDDVVCLFMGRLHPRKGVEALAQAFLKADIPHTRLLIVGPDEGLLPTLEALAVQSEGRIVITGYLTGESRLGAYAAADLFALPAQGEGLSMAVIEALASGIPTILSPECYLPEVEPFGAGMIVDPTVEALTTSLRELLTNTAQRRNMAHKARAFAQLYFDEHTVALRLEQLYQQSITL